MGCSATKTAPQEHQTPAKGDILKKDKDPGKEFVCVTFFVKPPKNVTG